MNRSLVLLAFLLVTACQGKSGSEEEQVGATPSPPVGQEFSLKKGEAITLEDGLTVELISVTNESRCPQGLRCVWQGNAQVNLQIFKDGKPVSKIRLNTLGDAKFPSEAKIADYSVRLTALIPQPVGNTRIAQSKYAATVVVVK